MNAFDLQQYGDKIVKIFAEYDTKLQPKLATDRTARDWSPEGFINADPSSKYTYLRWIISSYIDGGIKLYEDVLSRVKPDLEDYMYLVESGKLKQGTKPWENEKNILNYCGIAGCTKKGFEKEGLEGLLHRYNSDLESRREKQKETDEIHKNSEVIRDNDEFTIIWPKTEEASCYYGRGTTWCTAATRATNMFKDYNDKGKLYIVIPKKPIREGEKYQLHVETDTIMDENDDSVDLDDFIERFPTFEDDDIIHNFFNNRAFLEACEKGDLEAIKDLIDYVDPSMQDNMGIFYASRLGHKDIVEFLLNDNRVTKDPEFIREALGYAKTDEIYNLIRKRMLSLHTDYTLKFLPENKN